MAGRGGRAGRGRGRLAAPPAFVAALALALAACGAEPAAEGGSGGPVAAATVAAALDTCRAGAADAGIAALDTAIARVPGSVDALATRGLCYWTRSAEGTDPDADAERAYADLTAAIDAAEGGAAHATPLDRLYGHRAFVAQARDGAGWAETLADLDAAVRLAPRDPRHTLDRGVVRLSAGDTAAARVDLARFLVLADSADAARREFVEAMLDDLTE
ncbi:tetratricopeptide repeat protein [Rubrivirga sp. S365]|uniref:tetratricopeptide repeat protein n=1 Tax=Rubrivirga sp. S365 TaxID=3076080 RepID=UPI0028C68086|nr:tetratricopeptide repeat protein [Rubrivirga sp. S365]MDT7857438.1 tetratricopeptide repeat protein [Rubrivirga sp. S365]